MKDYIQYLSFEGSGSETIIYVGVIKFLLKYNMLDNLKGIIGSGFGAIIALMIVLKLTYNEIEEIMLNTNMTNIINVKLLVKKDTLDTILQNAGDLFIVINKHVYSYPSIASHEVVFNQGYLDSALHCNSGAEYEKLYTIKRVNVPVLVDSYYKKFQKYITKLNKI